MKRLDLVASIALAVSVAACAEPGGAEVGADGAGAEPVAELSAELKVGDPIVFQHDMRGKLFPAAACQQFVGDNISFMIDGCHYTASQTTCSYSSETKTCTCAGNVQSVSC